ncbi:DUF2244 domain-containing protein [Marinobacter salicampi]|uniref:DUF2244 domain-containing protein n=1 Tax=Marinobacter salicampi TaxID=435907 RepID=UPI00140A10E7|nr:DUF2244 domain-containing protein [Marinobacter salicampi]
MVEYLDQKEGIRLRLSPNRSLSWQGNVRIWLGLCLVSAAIVAGMIWAGAWVVLPFAGIELAALAGAFYYTSRQCHKQEILTLTADTLRLEKGLNRKEAEWALPVRYARVHVKLARHPFTPPKLFLMHRDTDVSLAAFLNIEDTATLLGILEKRGVRIERARPPVNAWF